MQNSEAVDEIKPLLETIERERVHPSILNGRAQQAMDCAEAFSAPQLDAPPRSDPEAVLLVVDRHHVLGRSPLGKEGVEAVKAADIEHAHPGEVLGKRGHAIAMVTRGAGRIDALSAVQRKGVKPEGTDPTVARARAGSTSIATRSATCRPACVTTNRSRARACADPVIRRAW